MKELIEYVSPDSIDKDIADFEGLTSVMFREAGFIKDFLKQPGIETATISFEGEPAYIIAFHLMIAR